MKMADLMERLAAGGTVHLPAGTYRLTQPVEVARPLAIVGAGREETLLIATFEVDADLTLVGLTVSGGGRRTAVRCRGGALSLSSVRVMNARMYGIDTCGPLKLADVDIFANGCDGVRLWGNGRLEATDVTFAENGEHGIAFEDEATGTLARWLSERNGMHGVWVCGRAAPQIENGIATGNNWDGVRFGEHARGCAYGNLCQENDGNGVAIADHAVVAIEQNTLRANGLAGLACVGQSGGRVHGNTADANATAPYYQEAGVRVLWGRNEGAVVKAPAAGREATGG